MLFRKNGEGKCEFRSEIGGYPALRLCQNWWNAQDIVQEYSVDEIISGMASQIAEGEDNIVVEDLRGACQDRTANLLNLILNLIKK